MQTASSRTKTSACGLLSYAYQLARANPLCTPHALRGDLECGLCWRALALLAILTKGSEACSVTGLVQMKYDNM